MSKHTPGPWQWIHKWNILKGPDSGFGEDMKFHGTVLKVDDAGDLIGSDADFRLIASAPQLLEALKAMVERGWHEDWLQTARASIRAAEGEE